MCSRIARAAGERGRSARQTSRTTLVRRGRSERATTGGPSRSTLELGRIATPRPAAASLRDTSTSELSNATCGRTPAAARCASIAVRVAEPGRSRSEGSARAPSRAAAPTSPRPGRRARRQRRTPPPTAPRRRDRETRGRDRQATERVELVAMDLRVQLRRRCLTVRDVVVTRSALESGEVAGVRARALNE